MKIILKILLLLLISALSVNAVAHDSAMQNEIDNLKGKSVEVAIKKWGKPASVEEFGKGYRMYSWDEARLLIKTGSKYRSIKNIFITEKAAKSNMHIYRSSRYVEVDPNDTILNGNASYLRYED